MSPPSSRSLAAAYLDDDPAVLDWYGGPWRQLADLQAWWAKHQTRSWPRAALATIFAGHAQSPVQRDALRSLADPGSCCVVTGQQPAYGGGPLYTLLKTAHAVALAEALQRAGQPAVAVFWCASEDHDAGEADHADLIDDEGRLLRLRMPMARPGAATRHQPASAAWAALQTACQSRWPRGLGAAFLAAQAPQADEGLGAWLCRLMAALFADAPLLCLEAHQLRPLWAPMLPDLLAAWPAQALEARRQALLDGGFEAPLGPLPQAPLFRDLPSQRLPLEGESARQCPAEELSSGAALRPVLQQCLLPACAYVGGPGEIAYHAQLGPIYTASDAAMPCLVARQSGALLDAGLRRGLEAWHCAPESLRADSDAPQLPETCDLAALEQSIAALQSTDTDSQRRIDSARTRLQREVLRLRASLQRAERQRAQRRPFGVLQARLFPRGLPQERVMSLSQAIWCHGPGLARHLVQAAGAAEPWRRRIIRL